MKKLIFVFLMIICLLLASGCTQTESKKLDIFREAINSSDVVYKLEYEKKQTIGQEEVNVKIVNKYVVSYEEKQAKVYNYEKTLSKFNPEKQYIVTEDTIIYNKEEFEELKIDYNLASYLEKENYESYTITNNTIEIYLKKDIVKSISSEATDIIIKIEIKDKQLLKVVLEYNIAEYQFIVLLKIGYTPSKADILK